MSSLRSLSNEGTSSAENMQTNGPGVKRKRSEKNCHQCHKNDKETVVGCTKCKKKYCDPCITRWLCMSTRSKGEPLELFDPEIEATARHNNARRRREMAANEQQAPNLNSINQRGGYENNNYRGKNQFHQGNWSNLSYGNPNNALQPPPDFSITNEMINEEKKPKIDGLLMAFMGKTNKFMGESQARVGGNQFFQGNQSNLSYGDSNNALQPPPGFAVTNEMVNEEKKPKMDDLLIEFMAKTNKFMRESQARVEKLENAVGVMGVQMKMFEKQLGQLATVVGNQHQSGQFPSNTTVNPKEQCSAIHLHTDVPTPLLAAAVIPPKTASENPNSTIKSP